jgi:UDP-glucose 4-epimerase
MIKKNVLIIGGGGFIGLNLAMNLNKNFNIFIVSRTNFFLNKILQNNRNLKLISNDISHITIELLNKYNFESILWLAHNSVPASNNDLISGIKSDINPLILFLEILKEFKKPIRFIYFSSGGAVYGNTISKRPISEISNLNPISNYGYFKLICENTIKYILFNTKVNTIIIRPSNVYGPLQSSNKPQGLISHVFKCCYNNIELNLYDDGNITRDYIHINDLSNFIELVLENKDNFHFEIFNVGSSLPTKNDEVISIIQNLTNCNLKINHKHPRIFDCLYNVLDITKAINNFDWKPKISLNDGIEDYSNWYLSNLHE